MKNYFKDKTIKDVSEGNNFLESMQDNETVKDFLAYTFSKEDYERLIKIDLEKFSVPVMNQESKEPVIIDLCHS